MSDAGAMSLIGVRRRGAAGVWAACALVLAGFGCGDDAGPGGPAVDVNRQASAALTQQLDFANGSVEDGALPKTTADDVTVSDGNGTYDLQPDAPADVLALEVDNPNADDPVAATLLQFEGDDAHHIEIPVDGGAMSDAGTPTGTGIAIPFSVSPDACAELCNQVYTLTLVETVQLESGAVAAYNRVVVELDCRQDGAPARCPAGAASSEEESLAEAYVSALDAYETAVCGCFRRGGLVDADASCAGFFGIDAACVGGVIESHADEISTQAECERAELRRLATCFEGATCDDVSVLPCGFGAASDPMGGVEAACGATPDDVRSELDACLPSPGASTASRADAGP